MDRYAGMDETALVQATVQQLAVQDVLTGLYKRHHFLFLAGKELERSHRYRRPIALILVDLDHFQTINDVFGRTCGDQALSWVSGKIKSLLRSTDVAGRYAGETFAILLPATGEVEALATAERIRQAVAAWESPHGGTPLTASVGVVCRRGGWMLPPAEMLYRASESLEKARQQGRNRVELQMM